MTSACLFLGSVGVPGGVGGVVVVVVGGGGVSSKLLTDGKGVTMTHGFL